MRLGFGSDALGIDLCRGDDVLGFALGAGALGLVFFKQIGGFLLEAAGIVELGLDAFAAMIKRRQHQACTSELDFIRTVLPEADVERVAHMVAGARHCAYEVRARG